MPLLGEAARVRMFRVLLILVLAVITWLATTDSTPPVVERVWDKGNHFIAFFVLAGLLDFSFPRRRFSIVPVLLLLSYGLLLELIQWGLPSRHFSLLDCVADGVGVLIYLLFIPAINKTPLAHWRLN